MASIPLVALAANTQQPSPLDQYSKAVQLKGLLQQQQQQAALAPGQQQLQQQAIQGGQQEQQMRDIQLKDAQAGMKAMQAWDGKDPNELPDLIRQNGGSLNAVMGAKAAVVKQQTDYANMNLAQLNAGKQKSDYLLGKLQAATGTDVPDAQLGSSILQAAQESVRDGYLDPQHAQQLQQMVQQSPNPADLRSKLSIYEKSLMGQSEQLAQTNKQKELENATQTANAAMLRAKNTSPSAEGVAAAAAQGDPNAIATQKKVVEQAAAAAAAEAQARLGVENSPAAIQGAVNKAVATQNALTSGSNAALAGVPAHLVAPATADATKAGQAYTQAQQAGEEMQSMIQLAKQGNKIAYAYSPVTGVLQINVAGQIKRMNMPEIESYGGAGSAADRIKGFLGKQVSGASIPDNVLNDMDAVSKMVTSGAAKKYQSDLDVINQNYGSKFTAPSAAKGTTGGQVKVTDPRGVVHTFPDQKSADAFKAAAGIH